MTLKKAIKLGPDKPKHWEASLLEMDAALAGKKTKYWHRVIYPKPLGKREVKALRQSVHLTQLAFARVLGMSLSTVRSWEQGTKQPDGLARKVLRSAMVKPALLEDLARA